MDVATRQPTIMRANTSMTNATYTKPAQVATYVKSATQSWLGRSARNSRRTRSAAVPGEIVREVASAAFALCC